MALDVMHPTHRAAQDEFPHFAPHDRARLSVEAHGEHVALRRNLDRHERTCRRTPCPFPRASWSQNRVSVIHTNNSAAALLDYALGHQFSPPPSLLRLASDGSTDIGESVVCCRSHVRSYDTSSRPLADLADPVGRN